MCSQPRNICNDYRYRTSDCKHEQSLSRLAARDSLYGGRALAPPLSLSSWPMATILALYSRFQVLSYLSPSPIYCYATCLLTLSLCVIFPRMCKESLTLFQVIGRVCSLSKSHHPIQSSFTTMSLRRQLLRTRAHRRSLKCLLMLMGPCDVNMLLSHSAAECARWRPLCPPGFHSVTSARA